MCVCVCAFVCKFVCLCVFVPVLCHSIPSHFCEPERPRPRHGTKRRWRDLVAADVQAVALGVAWYGVAQDGKEWEEWPTHLTASVEELSTGKETVHDIPTTAPTVPSDLLLVNIQGIVPQDATQNTKDKELRRLMHFYSHLGCLQTSPKVEIPTIIHITQCTVWAEDIPLSLPLLGSV